MNYLYIIPVFLQNVVLPNDFETVKSLAPICGSMSYIILYIYIKHEAPSNISKPQPE